MTDADIITGILSREKGFVNRAADRGGPTNYGITQATLAEWRRRPVTVEDVRALTMPEASAIISARYLAPWAWVPDERVREFCIDWAVTSWHDDPSRALQRAVGASVDGLVGPETKRRTLDALAARQPIFTELLRARLDFVMALALDEPRLVVLMKIGPPLQIANLRGWVHRCAEFIE